MTVAAHTSTAFALSGGYESCFFPPDHFPSSLSLAQRILPRPSSGQKGVRGKARCGAPSQSFTSALPPPNLHDRSLAWANPRPPHPAFSNEREPGYGVLGTLKEETARNETRGRCREGPLPTPLPSLARPLPGISFLYACRPPDPAGGWNCGSLGWPWMGLWAQGMVALGMKPPDIAHPLHVLSSQMTSL